MNNKTADRDGYADATAPDDRAIQPCGCLVCFDRDFSHLLLASGNIEEVLGIPVAEALGKPSRYLRNEPFFDEMMAVLEASTSSRKKFVQEVHWPSTGENRLQVTAWRSGDRVVVEYEPLWKLPQRRILAQTTGWLNELAEAESQEHLQDLLMQGARALCGHDRILIYQLEADDAGTVVAELKPDHMPTYLGYHFPASAVPDDVRHSYDLNPVRSIPDVSAPMVPLIAADHPLAGEPLDLTPSSLRAVPASHLDFLREHGVGASLSVAIREPEGLWGLLVCHAMSATPLSPTIRDAVLTLAQMASQRLAFLIMREQSRYARRVLESRSLLTEKPGRLEQPDMLVETYAEQWLDLIDACGLALLYDRTAVAVGTTPATRVLFGINRRLTASHHETGPWYSDRLPETVMADAGDLENCAGLLAVPLPSVSPPAWLLFFRQEQRQIRHWASPLAEARFSPWEEQGAPLTPFFKVWEEHITGRSEPWHEAVRQTAEDLAEDLAVAVSVHRIAALNKQLKARGDQYAEMARTDALTDIWNRFYMEEELDKEIAAAERYGRPCAVLLFDIDHFKAFNDNFGHEAGDKVLTTVAGEIDAHLRSADHFGRWGGEEFIILAGNTPLDEGLLLAERVREQVAAIPFGELGTVTISIGVAEWQPGDDRRTLVARADEAMYQAKQNGRNCVKAIS